ncbi:hypothetical protein MTO96_022728 [Rhipicephalus appendiculatus]
MSLLKATNLVLLAVVLMVVYDITSAHPHYYSHPVYCDRNRPCTPSTVREDCGPSCRLYEYRKSVEIYKRRKKLKGSGANLSTNQRIY